VTPWKKRKIAKEEEQKRQTKKILQWGLPIISILICLCLIGAILEQNNDADTPPASSVSESIPPEMDNSQGGSEVLPEDGSDTQGAIVEGTEPSNDTQRPPTSPVPAADTVSLSEVPAYSGEPYVAINNNTPSFNDEELTTTSFETYSTLDYLGRCGVAYACIGTDLMPTEDRGSISEVTPSGWINKEYDGQYLYNRCHLIGFQLSGENANERNLITGTRYMNVEGMLPFENMIADYVHETDNHVLYRVTPIYDGTNLVASGVQLEAESVEDDGEGVLFNVYVYNVQPGITIDYATGESWQEQGTTTTPVQEEPVQEEPEEQTPVSSGTTYILNTNTKKFHYPSCSSVDQMSDKNRQEFTGTRDEVIAMGYDPCGRCHP
jgi:DNA-entry nuclease